MISPHQLLVERADALAGGAGGARLVELPAASPAAAADSWFTGYSWSVLVAVCGGGPTSDDPSNGGATHLGWKFVSPTTGDTFVALIVATAAEDERADAARAADAAAERLPDALRVGTAAPAWMVALLSATAVASGAPGKARFM